MWNEVEGTGFEGRGEGTGLWNEGTGFEGSARFGGARALIHALAVAVVAVVAGSDCFVELQT